MKLLYAEDERDLSQAIVDILEYHQYQVDAVYDGQSALDFALQMDYDGIILDIMMPKLDGYEVLKILRQKG
ncbi:response regulator [Floccifex sp.]|uniref:response regulator n=1 Tax=Floccifex sp. TaxID=2815810 RepID=UPI003F09A922